ncbi:MAG: nicotinate-nucleotide diphosphorylase (carboxylating), partial [Candidatus Cloacimonadaceae bacterium]|nr:nicotinate-nucleotide diphosphorylase (carboxylating) [Candidatus Cloacimonadaceae bacterium]
KYAVRVGGGFNHRFGLYDMVLIKENHIRAAGGISQALQRVKRHNCTYKIEIEVTNLQELEEAVSAGADRVMLDNMTIQDIRLAVRKYRKKIELEVSGGVNETNIQAYAKTGVHYISSGSMTHSYKSLDISLLIKE